MVSGCSGGIPKDNTDSVVVSDDVVSDLIMAEVESDVGLETDVDAVENSDTSETEEQSGDSSDAEESTADTTTMETDVEPSTTEAPSEPETVTTEPATPPVEQQANHTGADTTGYIYGSS